MGEFGGGVCGGSWWNSSQNLFGLSSCSLPINDTGNFEEWKSHDVLANTTCTSYDSTSSASDKSVVLQEFDDQPNTYGNMASTDSNVNMIETSFFLSTNTQQDWNQDLVLDNGKLDENYYHLLQEATPINSSMNYRPPASSSLYNYDSVQNLLRHLFDIDSQPEQSIEDDNYFSSMINSNDFMSSLSKASSKPKFKQQNHSQVANRTCWNSSAAMDNFSMSLRRQSDSHSLSVNNIKRNNTMLKVNGDEITNDGPIFKRPRIETPSPLPTFKVRKEKMGDRITALQQLVSPFGKTDTASVLYEAIEYIKFLHDQVNALSTPYLKSGSPPLHCQQATQKVRYEDLELNKDLKSRGLCLVPVSSTLPVASETTADFWTPTFGGRFN